MREDVLHTIAVIAENPSAHEQTIVERLVETGYDVLDAELLTAFVPLGLGRAVIARLPVRTPIVLSETALIKDYSNERILEVRLAEVPEFRTARQLGERAYSENTIPRDVLTAASSMSVELNLINQALNAGKDISGGTMAAPILLRLASAPGFDRWYRESKGPQW